MKKRIVTILIVIVLLCANMILLSSCKTNDNNDINIVAEKSETQNGVYYVLIEFKLPTSIYLSGASHSFVQDSVKDEWSDNTFFYSYIYARGATRPQDVLIKGMSIYVNVGWCSNEITYNFKFRGTPATKGLEGTSEILIDAKVKIK